ncbi:Crp/Fnr family transcriptional regulator [Treponema sp.]|uniref:Crp/Fnr family transcriptional regulator n=1 Tax=Treponema sp. TaxID=166 RepID=UPI00388E57ED
MEKKALLKTPLFTGIKEDDFQSVLKLLNATERTYTKGETVFHSGSVINQLGIILEGRIQIESTDFWGNKTILDSLGEGKVFAETYALTKVPLMVDVTATQESKILLLQTDNLGSAKDEFSQIITKNLLTVSMKKNLHLSQRIFHTSSKTIRGRLLSYLSSQVPRGTPNAEFDIPYDRQQLADYLEVDRSALSAELSKMKADGLIDYWKNHFKLLGR